MKPYPDNCLLSNVSKKIQQEAESRKGHCRASLWSSEGVMAMSR